MKLNYQERIDVTADELKIICSHRRELQLMDKKFRHRHWLKTGSSQSLTDVGERQVYIELLYIDGSNNIGLRVCKKC